MLRLGIWLRQRELKLLNTDNLHRVAISNLQDQELSLKRWWHNKYKVPPKPIDEYTAEELYIEHLEDYYAENPNAINDFLRQTVAAEEWDGNLSPEQERRSQERWNKLQKRKPVDLSKYQSDNDKDLTDDDITKILASVGKDLPGSRLAARRNAGKMPAPGHTLGGGVEPMAGGEFNEDFGG